MPAIVRLLIAMPRPCWTVAVIAAVPLALGFSGPASARDVVEASAPSALSVTLYRDPSRGADQAMNRDWPQGFAMIAETREVTLPPGESTIRFTGVAEGMVAVSAIVTGLPGGTIEKNRNADLLSPAALVDGTLGNRVTVTRTNPVTGIASSESAVVRTRADGGLVLQTAAGFEAVRCSGLPEKLTFDRVPAGLSAQPVFSVDTRSTAGGTWRVQLTYLAWGFDWQAHYVGTLAEGRDDAMQMRLASWLTLLNDNGQSFDNAELLVVAGRLNVVSDLRQLSDPPTARPLQLACYPLGSTAAGSPEPVPPPPPPAPMMVSSPMAARMEEARDITVTGMMKATEENLGDLKLYRVPERVTVSAKGLKQVAFLDQGKVQGRLLYRAYCAPGSAAEPVPAQMLFVTVNDKRHDLGMALPQGGVTLFEPAAGGLRLVAEGTMRDHAAGQDVELPLGGSGQVFVSCDPSGYGQPGPGWKRMAAVVTNANPRPVSLRLQLGPSAQWRMQGLAGARVKDGQITVDLTIPANSRRELRWQLRQTAE
ncbi:MAG: hypothetical protein RLZZ08_1387 [Pseudomonadota bacterium]|jgi:hypothetical protein